MDTVGINRKVTMLIRVTGSRTSHKRIAPITFLSIRSGDVSLFAQGILLPPARIGRRDGLSPGQPYVTLVRNLR